MKKMLMVAAIALLVGIGAVYAETEGPAGMDPHFIYEFCPSQPYIPRDPPREPLVPPEIPDEPRP